MSVIYKGEVLQTSLTLNANGGTEQMRSRLLKNVESELLSKVAIHFSRPTELFDDVPNILYCHDLAEDSAVSMLREDAYDFDYYVFVSYWQRNEFINRFNLPYSKCIVIHNAIETEYDYDLDKPTDKIRFIYHTTPHRGLQLAYATFNALCKFHDNIHFDVYSSFSIYGWEERDKPYVDLFEKIKQHPNMTYHGAKSNADVLEGLRKAHVFLYPSIWKETSCIALIEAMNSGCLCVYPSYGALNETGSLNGNALMYEYSEIPNENASNALYLCHWIVEQQKEDKHFIKALADSAMSNSLNHTIPIFKMEWDALIQKVIDNSSVV
jgi:UDP-glucose:(glucosyl)LPS alpha-1,2-glucosyltransferase